MASLLKKIGRLGRKVVGGAGDVLKVAAPALNFVPGVGPLGAAAAGALGGLAGQLNNKNGSLGQGLMEGALSGAASYGVGALKGSGAFNSLPRLGREALGTAGGVAPKKPGGIGGLLGDAVGWLGKNPEIALAGLGAVQGARQQGRADDLTNQAVQIAQAENASREPFRNLLLQRLGAMQLGGQPGSPPQAVPAGAYNPYARRAA